MPPSMPSSASAPWNIVPGGQGAAPDDGFTSYKSQVGNPPRTRWGDYGAAAVDGNSIWIASEYIASACDYTTWGGPFFAGGTGDNLLGTCAGAAGGAGRSRRAWQLVDARQQADALSARGAYRATFGPVRYAFWPPRALDSKLLPCNNMGDRPLILQVTHAQVSGERTTERTGRERVTRC